MHLKVCINYPSVNPHNPKEPVCRLYTADLTLREVKASDVRLAYRVGMKLLRKDNKFEYRDYFFYDGRIYRKLGKYETLNRYLSIKNPDHGFHVTITGDPLPNLKGTSKKAAAARELAEKKAQEYLDSEYLIINNMVHVYSDLEPVYSVYFDELRRSAGISIVFESKDAQKQKSRFSALDKDAAVDTARALAELMSDSPLSDSMIEDIEVFMPEVFHYPRVERVTIDMLHPLEMHIEHLSEPEYRCPNCHVLLDRKYNYCPRCKKPLCWEAPVVLSPGEVHCSVCDAWIATINRDGSSYASSAYNGTDICDSCMIEHCCSTNCYTCKIGNYPNCQFQNMKNNYLQSDD